jgi:hypothetical protein
MKGADLEDDAFLRVGRREGDPKSSATADLSALLLCHGWLQRGDNGCKKVRKDFAWPAGGAYPRQTHS